MQYLPGRRSGVLHGVGLVDTHALDDWHAADERFGFLEAIGVQDAVADERRRRLEIQGSACGTRAGAVGSGGLDGVDAPARAT